MIIERLNDGKAEAKAKNPEYREGRKYMSVPELDVFRKKVADGSITVTEACRKLGISRSKWYKETSCRA